MPLHTLVLLASALSLSPASYAPPPRMLAPASVSRSGPVGMMGRKFENNKLKMAKTALAYAKKASYIGKKVVVAVKSGGDDPSINRQLAAVMAEAILNDRKRMFPCSAYLSGQYGMEDVYIGVPVILGRAGVEQIIELDLLEDELGSLQESGRFYKTQLRDVIGYND